MLSQIPYTIITLGTFEFLENEVLGINFNTRFNKNDDYPFIVKFMVRFGASTLSIIAANTILYPLDTIKRCLQLNGSKGHKTLYTGSIINCAQTIMVDKGIRGLYAGFGLNLLKTVPLTAIHLIIFNSLRVISKPTEMYVNPILTNKQDRLKWSPNETTK